MTIDEIKERIENIRDSLGDEFCPDLEETMSLKEILERMPEINEAISMAYGELDLLACRL